MKFATYMLDGAAHSRFGFKKDKYIIDVIRASIWANETKGDSSFFEIPTSLKGALENWDANLSKLKELYALLPEINIHSHSGGGNPIALLEKDIQLLAPVPNPQSFRDFYAFEQHVRAARKLRGLEIHPDWFKIPVFYFSNPSALYGHGEDIPYPKGTEELDFELEFAIIIANGGSDIAQKDAHKYIAGYTICNDWSARDLQREEMAMSLGPAKGKDFANSFGPYMVTPDELEDAWDDDRKLHLRMTCHVNGKLISDGNTNDLYHPFTKMIERASMNAKLLPGDILGSGTVGTGCILELRPENVDGWIKKGDTVKMEIERLGILENQIV
ncbi:MAG: fumarylacetoacetate hydrolase family protein [Candidatus Marinimicrobia bacterium]|jgi:fumarylacetoacetate (FAA) hydrolase|nr:fumarylacetoacetate hydrolase family protein [Candidatus Neomarinimicrobiota bacterium]MBT4000108.1 fumarylacetoacetate hydrolase family protein [Candidatus Neomarinimicrobiota bacterium]MBT4281962.1 fumarylacetoacetate hydrolase family protein [Candidatus Neomarinimicrobiota bacterium]MBT4579730.1 fumarylacetoacetate hydrolase family protein [Candidatus Neomarinimicrobiota bacterium]MBT4958000.1 fumarylacetoacetate hydrolase family protein [Candidatus Neomarinimicrobiota bacterium]